MKRLKLSAILLAALMRGQTPGPVQQLKCNGEEICTPKPSDPVIRVFFNQMEVGSITGVSYEDGQYVLYASEPGKHPVALYRDTVVQLARLVLAVGDDPNAGMSMDFIPSAKKKFDADEVLDVPRFARVLGSAHPLAAALRASPGGADVLKQCLALKDGKPPKALRGQIADLLNQARARTDLESLLTPGDMLPETRVFLKTVKERSRRNRMELEDFFQGAVDKDVEDRYQVLYKASTPEEQEKMAPLLTNSRASAIWTAADTRLKMMVAGREGLDFRLGPSQQALCAEEARSQLMHGVDPKTGQFVDYFSLHLDYEDMDGRGVWFRNPVLRALADRVTGQETPACATTWSGRLSKRIPWILGQDDALAADLRALVQILTLQRGIVYFWQTAPLDPARLNLLQRDAEDLPSTPPKVVKSEIAFGARGEVQLLRTAGGIDWGGKNPAPHPPILPDPLPVNRKPLLDTPGFVVTKTPDGLMRIDITSILAP